MPQKCPLGPSLTTFVGDFVQEGHLQDAVLEKVTKRAHFVTPWTFKNNDFALKVLQNRYFHPSQKSSENCSNNRTKMHILASFLASGGSLWHHLGSPWAQKGCPKPTLELHQKQHAEKVRKMSNLGSKLAAPFAGGRLWKQPFLALE